MADDTLPNINIDQAVLDAKGVTLSKTFEKAFSTAISTSVTDSVTNQLDLSFKSNVGDLRKIVGTGSKAVLGIYSDFFKTVEGEILKQSEDIRKLEQQGAFAIGEGRDDIIRQGRELNQQISKLTGGFAENLAQFNIPVTDAVKELSNLRSEFNILPEAILKRNSDAEKEIALFASLSNRIGVEKETIKTLLQAASSDLNSTNAKGGEVVAERLKQISQIAEATSKQFNIPFNSVLSSLSGNLKKLFETSGRDFESLIKTVGSTAATEIKSGIGAATGLDEVLPELDKVFELTGRIQALTGYSVDSDVLLTGTREQKSSEIFKALQAAYESGELDPTETGRGFQQQVAFLTANLGPATGFNRQDIFRLADIARRGGRDPFGPGVTPQGEANLQGMSNLASRLTAEEIAASPARLAAQQALTGDAAVENFGAGMYDRLQQTTIGTVEGNVPAAFNSLSNAVGNTVAQVTELSVLARQFGDPKKADYQGILGYALLGPEGASSNLLERVNAIEKNFSNIADRLADETTLGGRLDKLRENPKFQEAEKTAKEFRDAVQTGVEAIPSAYANLTTALNTLNTNIENLKETPEAKTAGKVLTEFGGLVEKGGQKLTAAGVRAMKIIGETIAENMKMQ